MHEQNCTPTHTINIQHDLQFLQYYEIYSIAWQILVYIAASSYTCTKSQNIYF
jgi:hypothetical protein